MNFNKDLFSKTEAKEFGDFENLELGGHLLTIVDIGEYTSEISGNTSLRVCVDVAKGDKQEGFFKKQYDSNTNQDKKWSSAGTKYLSLKDEQLGYLKGFITAIENSNAGFKFNPDGEWNQLKGLKVAGQFGLEEYLDGEGHLKTSTKLIQFRSIDKLKDITIPKVKKLDGSYIDYEYYKNHQATTTAEEIFGSSIVETDIENTLEI